MNINIETLDILFDKPIAFNRIFAEITGSLVTGIILSQLHYWSKVKQHGEFYKTNEELMHECFVGRDAFYTAIKKIEGMGIFERIKKGIPAKTYYKINRLKLVEIINNFANSSNTDNNTSRTPGDKISSNPENWSTSSPETRSTGAPDSRSTGSEDFRSTLNITENTTEITTKNTTEITLSESVFDLEDFVFDSIYKLNLELSEEQINQFIHWVNLRKQQHKKLINNSTTVLKQLKRLAASAEFAGIDYILETTISGSDKTGKCYENILEITRNHPSKEKERSQSQMYFNPETGRYYFDGLSISGYIDREGNGAGYVRGVPVKDADPNLDPFWFDNSPEEVKQELRRRKPWK